MQTYQIKTAARIFGISEPQLKKWMLENKMTFNDRYSVNKRCDIRASSFHLACGGVKEKIKYYTPPNRNPQPYALILITELGMKWICIKLKEQEKINQDFELPAAITQKQSAA